MKWLQEHCDGKELDENAILMAIAAAESAINAENEENEGEENFGDDFGDEKSPPLSPNVETTQISIGGDQQTEERQSNEIQKEPPATKRTEIDDEAIFAASLEQATAQLNKLKSDVSPKSKSKSVRKRFKAGGGRK